MSVQKSPRNLARICHPSISVLCVRASPERYGSDLKYHLIRPAVLTACVDTADDNADALLPDDTLCVDWGKPEDRNNVVNFLESSLYSRLKVPSNNPKNRFEPRTTLSITFDGCGMNGLEIPEADECRMRPNPTEWDEAADDRSDETTLRERS